MFMAIPEIGCGNISLALQLLCLDEGRCDHQMMLIVTKRHSASGVIGIVSVLMFSSRNPDSLNSSI